jgi:hypothetical protein
MDRAIFYAPCDAAMSGSNSFIHAVQHDERSHSTPDALTLTNNVSQGKFHDTSHSERTDTQFDHRCHRLCLFLAKETRYLLSATDRATQGEVQQYLGQPSQMTTDETGEAVWTYHIREFVQGGNNAWTMSGTWWCDSYTLNFDAHGILRHWVHESQKCNAT